MTALVVVLIVVVVALGVLVVGVLRTLNRSANAAPVSVPLSVEPAVEAARREQRLIDREERLEREAGRIAERDAQLAASERAVEKELSRVAGLSVVDAKAQLIKVIETQAKRDAAHLVRDIEAEARDEGELRARKIVTLAIQRIASEQTAESVVTVLHLPSDDMKGRIIGREGRNIRTFESVTGVNLIIDDTP
jgi:ribonucrease Y